MSQTKVQLVEGLNINTAAPATALQIDSSGNINLDSNTLYVDATNNRVGIGNNAPGALLDLGTATTTQGYIKLRSTGSGAREANLYSPVGGGLTIDTNSYAYPVIIQADNIQLGTGTSGLERARIDSSGRLLVGTATSIGTSGGFTPGVQVAGNSTLAAISAGRYANSASPPHVVLQKSRNATIGSHTIVNSGDEVGAVSFEGSDGSAFIGAALISAYVDGTPGTNDMPGRLVFSTTADGASSPTERMKIRNDGQITTLVSGNPGTTNFGFSVNRTGSQGLLESFRNVNSADSVAIIGGNAGEMNIYGDGSIKNSTNSYGGLSDYKLKENIVDANSQWADLKALQVRNYNFKEGQTHTQIGLIAQEVELVSPGLVSESPDRDEEGNDLGTTTKSVNYSVLYMKAVKALQEAMERIETLEAANTDLAARITALEAN